LAGKGAQTNPDAPEKIRLDKWLWQARFFKTRALATAQITKGRVRLNGPATEAASLFIDLDPQPDLPSASTALE
jgi:ribosomal 50S subunit-recycling heat shock protein